MNTHLVLIAFVALALGPVTAAPPGARPAPADTTNFKFQAYDSDAGNTDPKNLTFQIKSPDIRQPSEFLKLGEMIASTKWRLQSFQYKTRIHPQHGEEDVSELTIVNTVTRETKVLTIAPVIRAK